MELEVPDALALDAETRDYLQRVAADLDAAYVRSLLLFGSAVTGERTAVSDIDLMVVLSDEAPRDYAHEARRICWDAAARQLEDPEPDGVIDRVLWTRTGMFRSGFVTSERAIRAGRFHEVFGTSRLAYVVTPWRTVMAGALDDAVAVYGPVVEPEWEAIGHPSGRRYREVLLSALLALVLATAQLPYQVVAPGEIRYSLEAYKWSLYNCAYHACPGRSGGLAAAIDCLPAFGLHQRFLTRRADPQADVRLLLGTPVLVVLLHGWTLWRTASVGRSG